MDLLLSLCHLGRLSRYVVGWMVAPRESAELAKRLIADTCEKQDIQPGQLTIHADRGSSMRSKPVPSCWRIWPSPNRTAAPMCRTTTHIRKVTFAR